MNSKGRNKENVKRKAPIRFNDQGPKKKPRPSSPVPDVPVLDDDAPDVSDEEEGGVEGETTIPRPTVLRAIKAVFTRLASVLGGTVSAQPLEVQRATAQLDHAFNVDTTSGKATDNDIKDFNWLSNLFRGWMVPVYLKLPYFRQGTDGLLERGNSGRSRMLPRYIWLRFNYFGKVITMLEAKFIIFVRDDDQSRQPTLRSAFKQAWDTGASYLDIRRVMKTDMPAKDTKGLAIYIHWLRVMGKIMHYIGSSVRCRARQLHHLREWVSSKYRRFAWDGGSIKEGIARVIIYTPSDPIFHDYNDGFVQEGIIIRATDACGPRGLNTNEEDTVSACTPLGTLTELYILAWIYGEIDFLRGGMTYLSWSFTENTYSFWAKQFPEAAADMSPELISAFLRGKRITPWKRIVRTTLLDILGPIRGMPGTIDAELPHPASRIAELLRRVPEQLSPPFLEAFGFISVYENEPDVAIKSDVVLNILDWDMLLPELPKHGVKHENHLVASSAKISTSATNRLEQGPIGQGYMRRSSQGRPGRLHPV